MTEQRINRMPKEDSSAVALKDSRETLSSEEFRSEVSRCVEVMRKGGIIAYPTDTVWGIGCDARNSQAVRKIYALKKRADHKAMIVLVADDVMLSRTVDEIPDVAWQLLESAVNPLTIVYDHGVGVAPELLGPDGSLGVRVCADPFAASLCRALRAPIVSTSANISGCPAPRFFDEISPEILQGVDYVADIRRSDKTPRQPSNVIRLSAGGVVKVLR